MMQCETIPSHPNSSADGTQQPNAPTSYHSQHQHAAFQAGDGPPQPLLLVPAWHRAVRHCRAGQCPERPYGTAHGVPAEPRGCAQTPDTNHSQNKAGCGFLPALPPCPGGCAVTADTSERCIASSPEAAPQGSLSVPFPCGDEPIGTPPGPTAVGADAARSPRSAFRVVGAGGGDGSAAPAGADSTELRQHGQPCTLRPGPAGQPSPNQQRDTELLPCPAGMGAVCDSTAAIPPPWQSPRCSHRPETGPGWCRTPVETQLLRCHFHLQLHTENLILNPSYASHTDLKLFHLIRRRLIESQNY